LDSLKSRIRKAALKLGIDYFGVSPVSRLKWAPKGHKPEDLLENAKSVVSIGVRIGLGVVEANKAAYLGARHAIYIYMVFGYNLLNYILNMAALEISRILEREGYVSTPIPASPPFDFLNLTGVISHRHVAVAAGLGELGWNGLLLTPDSGPRVRLSTILTSAELEPDPQYSGKPLCDKNSCKLACVKTCPLGAIHPKKYVSVRIGSRVYRYALIDRWKCRFGSEGLTFNF
jgi:epoxyqueuosine reductase QueG